MIRFITSREFNLTIQRDHRTTIGCQLGMCGRTRALSFQMRSADVQGPNFFNTSALGQCATKVYPCEISPFCTTLSHPLE